MSGNAPELHDEDGIEAIAFAVIRDDPLGIETEDPSAVMPRSFCEHARVEHRAQLPTVRRGWSVHAENGTRP